MKPIGHLLITLGFLLGALATVLGGDTVRWNLFVPSLVLGAVGVALARLATRQESQQHGRVAADIEVLSVALRRIVDRLTELNQSRQSIDVYDLRERLDELFPEDLDTFVQARESLAHRYGLQSYADLMSHFAAGERYLNRVWCCSADGYIDEAHTYLDRAAAQFDEAAQRLRSLEGQAA